MMFNMGRPRLSQFKKMNKQSTKEIGKLPPWKAETLGGTNKLPIERKG